MCQASKRERNYRIKERERTKQLPNLTMKTNRQDKNSENMKELRERCRAVIDSCTNQVQLESAKRYIKLAGLKYDPITNLWFKLKSEIIGKI